LQDRFTQLASRVTAQMQALRHAVAAPEKAVWQEIVDGDREVDRLELGLDDVCVLGMQAIRTGGS
jgi:hypothetical protein